MKAEDVLTIPKEDIAETARILTPDDIALLISLLGEKDDHLRYPAFLLLQQYAEYKDDAAPYWRDFERKLTDTNSFQRDIGALMIAANAKWASGEEMEAVLGKYLELLHDDKPTTIRLCVQGLMKIVPYHPRLHNRIAQSLISLDLQAIRETMRKLVLLDSLHVLLLMKGESSAVDEYIAKSLSGGILDDKAKRTVLSAIRKKAEEPGSPS